MRAIYNTGDTKDYHYKVTGKDQAAFHGELVHPVCSTFALAREIEWSTRRFVLEMNEEDEEGVGTMLTIHHEGPAFVGETLKISAMVKSFERNELICSFEVWVEDRLIAKGTTGQKILKKSKLKEIFSTFEKR